MCVTLWKLNSTMSLKIHWVFHSLKTYLEIHSLFSFCSSKDLNISLFMVVFFLAVTLEQHFSVFPELVSKDGSFPQYPGNIPGRNNKWRVFECWAFLQQVSCTDLGNSLGNIWYRSIMPILPSQPPTPAYSANRVSLPISWRITAFFFPVPWMWTWGLAGTCWVKRTGPGEK